MKAHPTTRPSTSRREPETKLRRLIACGALAPVFALTMFVVAASRVEGYDHVSDTMSKLNAQGVVDQWPFTMGVVGYAVLMGFFSAGLRRRYSSSRTGRILWTAIAVHAVLMIGVTGFHDDIRPGGFFTVEGAAHDVLAGLAFSALVIAMLCMVALTRQDQALRASRSATIILGAAMTVTGIAFMFISPDIQGVAQRVLVGLTAMWIILLAVRSMASARTDQAGEALRPEEPDHPSLGH